MSKVAAEIVLKILVNGKTKFIEPLSAQIELGRLNYEATTPETIFVKQPNGNGFRLPIVEPTNVSIPRSYVVLQAIGANRVQIENKSNKTIQIGVTRLPGRGTCEFDAPIQFSIDQNEIHLESPMEFRTLALSLVAASQSTVKPPAAALLKLSAEEAEPLVGWMENIIKVLQAAINSNDFFDLAAQSMVKLIGLDSGRVLLWDMQTGEWTSKSHHCAPAMADQSELKQPSDQILVRLLREQKTIWSDPSNSTFNAGHSLQGVEAVVAAPIRDCDENVIGALYGDRLAGSRLANEDAALPGISQAEAMLVQVLANSVGAGLDRVRREVANKQLEHDALTARARFGQFFGSELAEILANDANMLQSQRTEVTLLFGDIREFSSISQHLDPTVTMDWICDVMGALTQHVLDHQGVLVNYIGDEIIAMWGAPRKQTDQALLACRAALAIERDVPKLSEAWRDRLGRCFRVGVGLNTGPANVGNTGSRQKLQYGPLGNTVNLASRVQGLTKYLGVNTLVTAATKAKLPSEVVMRRICEVRVANITEPVGLFELRSDPPTGWSELRSCYEAALGEFERQCFRKATELLGRLVVEYPDDRPSLILLSRAVQHLNIGVEEPWDPSWIPPGK
jgi:adenylate cyclase